MQAVFLEYAPNEKQNFQIDLAYVQKGSQDNKLGRATKLDYLEFSPKVEVFTKADDGRGLYIIFGFGLNLLLNQELVLEDGTSTDDFGINDLDFTLQLGLGYKLENNLSIDLKLLDGSITPALSESNRFRNVGANLTFSYGFDL